MLSRDRCDIVKDYISEHRFFFHCFTASDGPTTTGRVVSHRSITVNHDFRSRGEACKKTKYRLRQTASHSSLLVVRHGDVSSKPNQASLLADTFNSNFHRRRTFTYIYIIYAIYNNNIIIYKYIYFFIYICNNKML